LPARNVVLTVFDVAHTPKAAFALQKAFKESLGIDAPIEKFGTLLGAGFGGEPLNTVQVEIYDTPAADSSE